MRLAASLVTNSASDHAAQPIFTGALSSASAVPNAPVKIPAARLIVTSVLNIFAPFSKVRIGRPEAALFQRSGCLASRRNGRGDRLLLCLTTEEDVPQTGAFLSEALGNPV